MLIFKSGASNRSVTSSLTTVLLQLGGAKGQSRLIGQNRVRHKLFKIKGLAEREGFEPSVPVLASTTV
jgi:hypothetical protein